MLQQVVHLGSFTDSSRNIINDNFAILSAMQFGAYKGGNALFVDGTTGHDGNVGTSQKPFATIQAAVTAADAYDTVFVKPKKLTDFTGDPTNYAETIIIPASKPHLSLIGLGSGPTQGNQPQIKKGSGSTALLTVRAPGCTIANLSFNGGSSTGGGILLDDDYSAKAAFGTVITDCFFKNCVGSAAALTGGAIMWAAVGNAWQVRILRNYFLDNRGGVVLKGTSNTRPTDVRIEGNTFTSTINTAIDCDVYLAGGSGVQGLAIVGNMFATVDCPGYATSPTAARYLDLTGCEGILAFNAFACLAGPTGNTELTFTAAGTAAKIPTTVRMAANYGEAATATGAEGLIGR